MRVIRGWLLVGLAAITALVLVLPLSATPQLRRPIEDTPDRHGLSYESLILHADATAPRIAAWLMPAASPTASIVLVHGQGTNRGLHWAHGLELAERLVAAGFNVMAIDLRGHGESDDAPHRPSLGVREADDVIAAVSALTERCPDTPVGAIGFSMGGAAAVHAAARDERLAAVVVIDGLYDPATSMRNAMRRIAGVPDALHSYLLWHAETLQGVPVSRASIIDLSLPPIPLLLVHGSDDPINTVDGLRRFVARHGQARSLLIPPPAADDPFWADVAPAWGTHGRTYRIAPEIVSAAVIGFFRSALGGSQAVSASTSP